MEFPEGLKYSKEHEWVLVEGKTATIGITEYAQEELGDIVYVELPEIGEKIVKDDPFGAVESVKAVSDVYAPVSGAVLEVNDVLPDNPETINDDPYGDGWMIRVDLTDPDDLKDLMDAEEYAEYVAQQKEEEDDDEEDDEEERRGRRRRGEIAAPMRYTPHTPADQEQMLRAIGIDAIEALYRHVPATLRTALELISRRPDRICGPPRLGELASGNATAPIGACFSAAVSIIISSRARSTRPFHARSFPLPTRPISRR